MSSKTVEEVQATIVQAEKDINTILQRVIDSADYAYFDMEVEHTSIQERGGRPVITIASVKLKAGL